MNLKSVNFAGLYCIITLITCKNCINFNNFRFPPCISKVNHFY